ncbi:hypothetical protein D9758_013770 [Tetrapyrgos nigripes]|uniref:Heme haloperoxidase family profile domain-containing protein n=1 Tax=Tetrapyrgos nigripes TaxID=182062 RepID=A0A8H5D4Z4_9AGAR|nr:hypothetical protein D9758_013770 [Tetrapyrgos nigripes]
MHNQGSGGCGWRHETFEHDISLSREDFNVDPNNDNIRFNETIFTTLANSNPRVNYYNATLPGLVQKERQDIQNAVNARDRCVLHCLPGLLLINLLFILFDDQNAYWQLEEHDPIISLCRGAGTLTRRTGRPSFTLCTRRSSQTLSKHRRLVTESRTTLSSLSAAFSFIAFNLSSDVEANVGTKLCGCLLPLQTTNRRIDEWYKFSQAGAINARV